MRVEEFRFIREEAKKLGVRAWLFGGTAAGYAHYVKWDLLRTLGDPRFQPDRFDYDYTNIYRSTQDLDIVIDGTTEQAVALQNQLAEKYPHLQGSKSAWEVRLLTKNIGDKQALLNNPDYLNQHTDSNSTGMVEITTPHAGDTIVRDLRDWNSKDPQFLKDVKEGALHYYFSPLHETTTFYKEGRNPPILSAIRYLTKAFQYELALRPEDLDQIKKVVDAFDPRQISNSYVSQWIEKNGKKLIQNAVNIEYAVNTLDQLGLRKKLADFGESQRVDSLAWWMNKEPLRSRPLGQDPRAKTAQELFTSRGWVKPGEPLVVAHETNSFLSYESITRAHTGDPNVLISRSSQLGETAVHGDGFYTRVGHIGARGTGLTVRFTLDPKAREGADFDAVFNAADGYIVVKNKQALRVIPESLNIGPVEYFKLLTEDGTFDHSDSAILEKMRRRINSKLHAVTPEQEQAIYAVIETHPTALAVREFFLRKQPSNLLAQAIPFLDHATPEEREKIKDVLVPFVLEKLTLEKPNDIRTVLKWEHPLIDQKIGSLIKMADDSTEVGEWIDELINVSRTQSPAYHKEAPTDLPHYVGKQKFKAYYRTRTYYRPSYNGDFVPVDGFLPQNIEMEIADDYLPKIANLSWLEKHRKTALKLVKQPYLSEMFLKKLREIPDADKWMDGWLYDAQVDLKEPPLSFGMQESAERIEKFLLDPELKTVRTDLLETLLSRPDIEAHPNWIAPLSQKGEWDAKSFNTALKITSFSESAEFVSTILAKRTSDLEDDKVKGRWQDSAYHSNRYPLDGLRFSSDFLKHPEWLDLAYSAESTAVVFKALNERPEEMSVDWIFGLLRGQHKVHSASIRTEITLPLEALLKMPYWRDHPQLREVCGGAKPTIKCLEIGKPVGVACVLQGLKRLLKSASVH